jgi:hypothetical protein
MVNKILFQTIIIVILSILVPVISFFVPWQPSGETLASWFQRSGSILVGLSVFAEFRLLSIHSTVNPGAGVMTFNNGTSVKQKKAYEILSSVVFVLAIFGTIIWGYGDIPFR